MGIIPELVLDPDHEIICDYVLLTSQLNTHISSDTFFSRILDVKKKDIILNLTCKNMNS